MCFKQMTAYALMPSLVGSEMCIADRGYFWRIVGIYLLSFLIVLVASQAASYGVSLITQGLVYAAPDAVIVLMALSTLLNSLVQAAILPFDSSVIALMYTDLRMRSEGLDVELRRAAGV